MKTALSVVGYISCILIIFGSLFKLQHWPGAGVMLVLGASTFSSFFCLFYVIYRVINRKGALDVIQGLALSTALSMVSIGMLFKIQHWPGSGIMLTVGLSVIGFIAVPILIFSFMLRKEKTEGLGVLYTTIGLAFICMSFAQNVSRDVLHSYVISNRLTLANNQALSGMVTDIIESIEDDDPELDEMVHAADHICELLDSYTVLLFQQTDKLDEPLSIEYCTADLLSYKDNYDTPSHFLIGDPGSIRTDEWSAARLRSELIDYRRILLETVNSEEASQQIEQLLDFDQDELNTWEVDLFYGQPMVSVLSTLATLKSAVLSAQLIAMNDVLSVYQFDILELEEDEEVEDREEINE